MMGTFDFSLFNCGFATGSARYVDHYPGDQIQNRIVLSLAPAMNRSAAAKMIVDFAVNPTENLFYFASL